MKVKSMTSINIPRAFGGIALMVAGMMGFATVYKDIRSTNAGDPVPEHPTQDYDHGSELPTVSEEPPVESDPMIDVPMKKEEPHPPQKQPDTRHMDQGLADALFMPKIIAPKKPVPIIDIVQKDAPTVGKLMSPQDMAQYQRIQDILYARAKTNNWDMKFPVVERNGVMWRQSEVALPAGLTLSMVVFTKTGKQVLFARGNLILDTLSRADQTVERRKENILKSVTLPNQFPDNATPIGVGTKVTMKSYIRKNRAYFGIPLRLVLTDGDPRLDASLMITTTSGQPLPSIERLIPLAMDATMGLFIAARASKLLGTHNLTLAA